MSEGHDTQVSSLLGRLREGDEGALDELFPLLYEELRALAKRQRAGWSGNETLNTTALIHEAYLKLSRQDALSFQDRPHFLRAASQTMRHILVNYAERRSARKRGGGLPPIQLQEVEGLVARPGAVSDEHLAVVVTLDRALTRLEALRRRQARIVECRVFGGMTIDETAEALDISPATVSRGWGMAQAWLRRELDEERG